MQNEFSRIVDALPGSVWTALPDGQVDFVNQSWCEYTGLGRDEACGHAWQAAIHPDDLPGLLERWNSILASGEPREMQARMRRFDGGYRRFVLQVRPLLDASGRILKWCAVNTDIEGRTRTEDAASARGTDFQSIIDSIPALVALMSPAGTLESVNRHTLEYLGATLEELKGWATADTVHPDDLPVVVATWMQAVETGEPYDIEHRIRRADGSYHWFHVRGLPLRDSEGRISRWCVVEADIEDRKRDEALLAGEKRLLEMVVRGDSRPEILQALCELVEDTIACCHCSVVLVDSSGMRMEHGAAPSLPPSFIDAIIGRPVSVDAGPCPMAVRLKKRVFATDLATETRWQAYDWSAMAMAHGLRACWSTPIAAAAGEILGVFGIYYDQPRSPTPEDTALIDQLTHIASIAIERQRSQASLAQALQEVRHSEDRLRTTVDAIPGFVWTADPDGSVDFLNERWCEYTGLPMCDALGNCWTLTIHPDDSVRLQTHWRALLEAGQPGEFEARLRRHDGIFRWFLIRTVPLRDETGELVKWYGQNTDIEDRKQIEMLLAGEKRLLKMMAGGAPLALILEVLCELLETTASNCSCSILLVDPGRHHVRPGAPCVRLQPGFAPNLPHDLMEGADGQPVDVDSGPCAMAAIRNEAVISADLSSETRWETWRSAAVAQGIRANWTAPISSTSGDVIGTLSVFFRHARAPTQYCRDLVAKFTHLAGIAIERARGEAELKQSQAFLAKAQRVSSTGTFSWRTATGEITWSEEIYRIYELDPAIPATFELIDTRLHPDDGPSHDEMRRLQRESDKDFEHEHRLLMPDGRVKYLHLDAHATRDDDGQLEYIGAVQDVTERRRSEEALGRVRSELAHLARVATLGALTASIAHEVNQPLAGIITNANTCLRMLAADPPNVDGARETARRTIRDGNRASDVIKRLRALFAKKSATTEKLDLNAAAREVIAMLLDELQRRGILLRTEFAGDLSAVMGDRVQLQQVILNLLLNASDAMDVAVGRPRKLLVRTERDGEDHVRLTVRDTGAGFDPGDADRLFTAFYTTKGEGMGIGLSISRSIIESHYGRLWATPNDGPGATFAFSIPCLPDSVAKARGGDTFRRDSLAGQDHKVEIS